MSTPDQNQPSDPNDPADQGRPADVLADVAEFLQLGSGSKRGGSLPLEFLQDVSLPVSVELGHASLPIGEVLKLEPGAVIELDRDVSHPVDLVVAGVPFARGEVVVVDDRFAVHVKELLIGRNRKRTR
jgi:flagellar motor switch protein FliN/FliY